MKSFILFIFGCISASVTLLVMSIAEIYSASALIVIYMMTYAVCVFIYGWLKKGSLREWLREFV